MTFSMVDHALGMPPAESAAQVGAVRGSHEDMPTREEVDRLQAELTNARSEIEFATLKEEEIENRHRIAQETVTSLRKQLADANSEVQALRRQLQKQSEQQGQQLGRDESLANECNSLRKRVSELEAQLSFAQQDSASRREMPPSMEFPPEGSEETPLLSAAYQQISVLNTQLAHLCTELTMARTEAQQLRAERQGQGLGSGQPRGQPGPGAAAASEEAQRQAQRVADLVSDIRHLQLDLEYHQQKLDQMLEEKQKMMKDMKKTKTELAEAKRQLEEQDQMLKHRQVDLEHLRQELSAPSTVSSDGAGVLDALRSEAAAKDSALIVSHYELHKEKLMRDRLEQKNLKLMERMQKLMMVVETMRKDNITLERSLASKDKQHEEKAAQLAQVTQKARQLQRMVKTSKSAGQRSQRSIVLELDGPHSRSALPLLQSQRSIDSARGSRSGFSTPRTPRAPATPYSAR